MPPDPAVQHRTPWWQILALSNDDPRKIVVVAVAVCLVCSVLVSGASVLLKPVQQRNQSLAIKQQILNVAGIPAETADVERLFAERIQTRMVNLETGEYSDEIDPATYDYASAARDPQTGIAVPPHQDIAQIKRRPRYIPVYLVSESGRLTTVILPVNGTGLWSTMYGFLALDDDGVTIKGLTFYEQAETPGLGDEVGKPAWQAHFQGKQAFDAQGQVRISVIKGSVNTTAPEARFQVDGIAGATLTSNGVTRLLHYWLGDQGYGPYLRRLFSQGGTA
jgi:Na+-transporting NADH:ubiquinone oxidoreductase subunit C